MAEEEVKLVREYLRKSRRRREIQEEADALQQDLTLMQDQILNYYMRTGHQKQRIDGGTVYLRRDLYASPIPGADGSHEQAIKALQAAGLGHLVQTKVNTQDLAAHVRDLETRDLELPPELEPHVRVSEVYKVVAMG